jgi:methionyl-tRNA formyltransferase
LPAYRGAAPINWAIINGELQTGVTTFFIDEKIDTGAIILQDSCAIAEEDTAGTLHDKLMVQGAQLVLKTVRLIEQGEVTTNSQKNTGSNKEAPKITKETCRIDWNQPVKQVYNQIRGLSPYPTAWTTLFNADVELYLKIYSVTYTNEAHTLQTGRIISDKKSIRIATPGGYIDLLEIQLPGKRKMKVQEVLNGLKVAPNAYVL